MSRKKVAKRCGAKARVKWGRVDWEKSDAQVAREENCSRERVRQKRRELGVGRSPMWHKRPGCAKEIIASMSSTESLTLKEIAVKAGCRPSYAMQCLVAAGKGWVVVDGRASRYAWATADWERTDEEVAADLGIGNPGVVSQYRFRHGIKKRVPAPEANPAGGTAGKVSKAG